jgi:two-component system cell cycle response regulator
MGSLSARVREHFAKREDPYAGADLDRIIRLGGVLWIVGVVVGAALLPLAPPTAAVDPALGWTVVGVMIAGGLLVAIRTFRLGVRMSTNEMLANAYTGLFSEVTFEWLAGGRSSPYHQLFMMNVLYVAVAHPPRRFAAYACAYLVATAAPFVYGPWTAAQLGDAGLQVLLTLALAGFGSALMAGVRRQRVVMHEQGAAARHDAETDALTGLGNRRALMHALERETADLDPERPAVLALFDLDGFKAYNDAFGHPAGDALLARLAGSLRAAVGDGRAYRMGGDEFCVLARTTLTEVLDVVDAASKALREDGDGFSIGASHGSALLPADTRDAHEALRIADTRMYATKSLGRTSAGRQSADVLLTVLAERDSALAEQVGEVAEACVAVGRELGLDAGDLPTLRAAGALHDIGKLSVPDAILEKPGPLTEDEWQFIRRHTVIGEKILRAAPALAPVAPLVRSSQEHFDGAGYPDGLAGERIPLGSRIVAVCDAFDAMTSDRPYRSAMSAEGALDELRRCAGSQFDPRVVAAFERAFAAGYAFSSPATTATAIANNQE